MSDSEKSGALVAKERTRMVICAIDSLKGRKARPDETKICNFVERRFGLKKDETIAAIKEAVTEGSVLKVKYKDSVSYRNPLKFSSKMSNHVMSASSDSCVTPQNVKHVLRELRALSRSVSDGVPLQSVVQSLHSKPYSVTYDQSLVDKVLIRAIEIGSVKQLPNGKYVLAVGKRIVARKADVDQSAQMTKSEDTDSHRLSDLHHPDHVSGELDLNEDSSHLSNSTTESSGVPKKSSSMTRERPASKRKKFKKSLGPDFIESSELGPQFMKDSFEPKCDLCQLRSKLNRKGDKEELLSCKDCNTKVHPSCMDYSEELAERSGRSPWQCMECKTCDICRDSKDGANMLVCDLCDKGFHMSCHVPAVAYKPSGKWVCAQCSPTDLKQRPDCTKKNTVDDNRTTITDTELKEELNGVTKGQNDNLEPIVVKANSESSSVSSLAFNFKEIYPEEISNPQKWSAEDVENYIRNIGFPEQSLLFKEQEIDGTSLLLLRRSDVLTGFHMKLGPALKIYSHIVRLQKND